MINRGAIILQRRIRDHWLWQDPVKLKWWLDILLDVNWKPDQYNIDGRLIQCGRGQSIKSLRTWGERWGVNRMKAKRFLEQLQKHEMISIESLKRTTRITVSKYDSYQKSMLQHKPLKPEHCTDRSYNSDTTCDENLLQLQAPLLEGCRGERDNLHQESVHDRSKEDSLFKQENSLEDSPFESGGALTPQKVKGDIPEEKKSEEDLDKEFELFKESEEANGLTLESMFPKIKPTPHDPTH